MAFLKRYKFIILTLLIAAVAYAAYTLYFDSEIDTGLIRGGDDTRVASVDRELLALLQSLQALTLDNSLLSTPSFLSLIDFSQVLNPEEVGRPNPFAPLETGASQN